MRARSGGKARSGFWSSLAIAADVNSAFISQITARKKDLSLEQAEKICRFLNLSSAEADYFLLLLQRERAGTQELKKYFDKKLRLIIEQTQSNIKSRLNDFQELKPEERATYYSHWIYSAVHIALTIPKLRTIQALLNHFQLDQEFIESVIEFLLSSGIAKLEHGQYFPSQKLVHLGRNEKIIHQHHINWRVRALAAIDKMQDENLHYSVVVSLSENDYNLFRSRLVELAKDFMADIKNSPEEILGAFNFDLFRMSAGRIS